MRSISFFETCFALASADEVETGLCSSTAPAIAFSDCMGLLDSLCVSTAPSRPTFAPVVSVGNVHVFFGGIFRSSTCIRPAILNVPPPFALLSLEAALLSLLVALLAFEDFDSGCVLSVCVKASSLPSALPSDDAVSAWRSSRAWPWPSIADMAIAFWPTPSSPGSARSVLSTGDLGGGFSPSPADATSPPPSPTSQALPPPQAQQTSVADNPRDA
mmetsp:Transcript_13129/g.47909  ORF Transcript_13129/g.47909 Transcript_13129/m.47909 type:complete len:216 (+) Transcript_13129:938-1585(+)